MAKPLPRIDEPQRPERPDTASHKPNVMSVARLENPPASEGYIPRNVDVRMTRAQAKILRDKLRALQDAGAKTADGKPVNNRAQAVRWILENMIQ
jgi:hypothetical protein